MAKKSVIDIIVNGVDKFSKEIASGVDASSKKLGEIGKSMQKTGTIMSASLTVPIVAGFSASVMAASNLKESISAVETVFGDASDVIYEFGQISAEQVGLSEERFNSLAIVTGSFLQNLGYDADDAAQETITLTERASDMAAVFNTDVDQALMAIQSGLKGEFNPLEQFGVKMNAAGIEAKAMAMGLADAEGNLDDNAKAQAALAIVMEQTNRIQGTFTEESEGLAGSLRIVKAQLGDAAAALGMQLLPYVTEAANYVRQLVERFNDLSPATQKIIVIVGLVVAAIGPLLMIVGTLISTVGAIIPVVTTVAGALSGLLLPIAAVIAIVALLALAWKNNFLGIQDYTKAAWDRLVVIFDAMKQWLSVFIPAAIEVITSYWNNVLLPAFQAVRDFVQNNLMPVFSAIADFMSAAFSLAVTILAGVWQNVLQPVLETVWSFVGEKLQPIFEGLANFWNNTLIPVIKTVAEWISSKLTPAFEGLKKILSGVAEFFDTLADKMRALEDKLPDWMTPGSPTPLELGLRGIDNALKDLTRRSLPKFESELNLRSNISGFKSGGGFNNTQAGAGNVYNYNLTMNTREDLALTPTQAIKRLNLLYGTV